MSAEERSVAGVSGLQSSLERLRLTDEGNAVDTTLAAGPSATREIAGLDEAIQSLRELIGRPSALQSVDERESLAPGSFLVEASALLQDGRCSMLRRVGSWGCVG